MNNLLILSILSFVASVYSCGRPCDWEGTYKREECSYHEECGWVVASNSERQVDFVGCEQYDSCDPSCPSGFTCVGGEQAGACDNLCFPDEVVCEELLCDVECEFGHVLDDNNCETCECKPPCPPVCEIFCEYGMVRDENNCEICECNEKPVCGPVCEIFCEYGMVRDENNCEICECNEKPVCDNSDLALCDLRCSNGFARDAKGCDICECHECGPVCAIACEFGNVEDEFGCATCECKEKPNCGPVCAIYCEFGNVEDENGCATCECNEKPVCDNSDLALCDLYCPNGFTQDKEGCDICECHECGPVCAIYCEFGNVEDENGCATCQCNEKPECDNSDLALCDIYCPDGFAQDKEGCDICECFQCPQYRCMERDCEHPVDPDTGCEFPCSCVEECEPVLCEMYCENGWAIDEETGCETCKCKECPQYRCLEQDCEHPIDENGCEFPCACVEECEPVLCKMYCEYGWATDKETGCEICSCAEPNTTDPEKTVTDPKTETSECGPVCAIYCEFGNVEDENGCPTCECKDAEDSKASTVIASLSLLFANLFF